MQMQALPLLMLWSVLVPERQWVPPDRPMIVSAKAAGAVSLVLADFTGSTIAPTGSVSMQDGKSLDLKTVYPSLATPGTYLLFAVPTPQEGEAKPGKFIGTPLVIGVRQDHRVGAPSGALVTRIQPLQYAEATTAAGTMTIAFYYDAAPVTIDNFLKLAAEGFYDGLQFHTIVPGFTIQTGDPKNDGTGGPGYSLDAEFNMRKHEAGTLSMSRMRDSLEDANTGVGPRPEFANSGGSQFFICLDYKNTQQYDRAYTAFGKVTAGMETVEALAKTPLADPKQGRPAAPPVLDRIVIKNVDSEHNPYRGIVNFGERH